MKQAKKAGSKLEWTPAERRRLRKLARRANQIRRFLMKLT